MRVAAALILIAALTGSFPAAAVAGAANGPVQGVTALTDPAQEAASRRPVADTARPEARTTVQDLAIFGLVSLGILGLLWIRRHTSEL